VAVENFLEDEDYEESYRSTNPKRVGSQPAGLDSFLAAEDDDEFGDSSYGIGFDSGEGEDFEANASDEFYGADGADATDGEEGGYYPRWEDSSGPPSGSLTSGALSRSREDHSSVPNFLEEEEDYEDEADGSDEPDELFGGDFGDETVGPIADSSSGSSSAISDQEGVSSDASAPSGIAASDPSLAKKPVVRRDLKARRTDLSRRSEPKEPSGSSNLPGAESVSREFKGKRPSVSEAASNAARGSSLRRDTPGAHSSERSARATTKATEPTVEPPARSGGEGAKEAVAAGLPFLASRPMDSSAAEKLLGDSIAVPAERKQTDPLAQEKSLGRRVNGAGATPAESKRAKSLSGSSLPQSNGLLTVQELAFYENLGLDISSVPPERIAGEEGRKIREGLRLPLFAEPQFRERERRIAENLGFGGSGKRGSNFSLRDHDRELILFMVAFKFISSRQAAKLFQVSEITGYKKLNRLRKMGLASNFPVLGLKGGLWVPTQLAMDISGLDLPRGKPADLTLSMVSHQMTVNHVAAQLRSSGINVLKEKQWPVRNRLDSKGVEAFGDELVSELQIQSSFAKLRGTRKADIYIPQIKKTIDAQFAAWQRAGGVASGFSPELLPSNEFMWALYPPVSTRLHYHVPDLVVARPRASDGSPQSIAVEVELRTKSNSSSYERTLEAYRTDGRIYSKVVWVCRRKATAKKIKDIAMRKGLLQSGKLGIVPIFVEDNLPFTGKDPWSL